jgi:16S rRNA (cytosine967-C5)-methyltransferase
VGHCIELLEEILARPATPADLTISRFFAARRYLGSHDRGFIADTVYGVLRDLIRLRYALADLIAGLPPEEEAPRVLLAYLFSRTRDLDTAPLRDLLGLEGREMGMIDEAVVSLPERIESLPEPQRSGVLHSLPAWLAGRIIEQMGEREGGALMASLGEQAPITLRANRLLTTPEELASALRARGIAAAPGRWAPDALLLLKRLNANAIPEFKSGWFEMQDEGSQLLSTLLDPHPNWDVFDACAGAGGKALHMSAIMKGRGAITAHDINERRLAEIRPRMRRSGAQNIRVMSHETYGERRERLAGKYDAVMIDAPCSGAGVLRRNPGARLTFDESMVGRLTGLQAAILAEYSALVKPGGLLLYATCSLLREENEEQVEHFLSSAHGWRLERPPAPEGMITSEGYFRSFPHRHGTDAFFGALLRRG